MKKLLNLTPNLELDMQALTFDIGIETFRKLIISFKSTRKALILQTIFVTRRHFYEHLSIVEFNITHSLLHPTMRGIQTMYNLVMEGKGLVLQYM
jgi:hypothetical protein